MLSSLVTDETGAGGMLKLQCPVCGMVTDETELVAGGEAHIKRVASGSTDAEFEEYMFMRHNIQGVNLERWRHVYGCGKWFHAARCSMTNVVYGTYPAQSHGPPDELIARIRTDENQVDAGE